MQVSKAVRLVSVLLFTVPLSMLSKVRDVDDVLWSKGLTKASAVQREAVVQSMVSQLKRGDMLLLSRQTSTGNIDLSNIADGVTIRWGHDGNLFLGGSHRNLTILDTRCPVVAMSKADFARGLTKASRRSFLKDSHVSNAPMISNMEMDNVGIVNAYVDGEKTVYKDGGIKVTGQWTNCSVLYVWFEYHTGGATAVKFTDCDATNSKVYGISETDYCAGTPSAMFTNVKGLTYGNGDTERPNSPTGIYQFINCENVTLVCHRNFHSHGAVCSQTAGKGYFLSGGKNNTFLMVQDIGDNAQYSLHVNGSENFKIFGMFLEDDERWDGTNTNPFLMFYTPYGFGGAPVTKWASPAAVAREKILSYQNVTIDTATTQASPAELRSIEIPRPPVVPALTLTTKRGISKRAFTPMVTASWGRRALELGADPTGRRSSHAALQQMIDSDEFVELPAGTLLLDKPLVIHPRTDIRKRTIAGAGKNATRLITAGNFPAMIAQDASRYLAKTGASRAQLAALDVIGQTYDGQGTGAYGYFQTGVVGRTLFQNNTYKNYTKAGVIIGNAANIDDIKYILKGDGFDQCRWVNCDFINTGDYGLYCNREQVDKQLYYDCLFEGQKKAGLSIQRSHMIESSSVVNCTFRNIDGPGVAWGANTIPGNGNAPVMNMLMNCIVEECGSETLPAIEFSFTNQALVVNNLITINNKKWKYGYAGTAAVLQSNTVNVNLSNAVTGAAAFAIRHPRRMANNRVTGNVISNDTSNGKLVFVDDIGSFEERFGEVLAMPTGRCEYPYAFTHLISNCSFDQGKQTYDYVLVRTAKDASVQEILTLGKSTSTVPRSLAQIRTAPGATTTYDLSGRLLSKCVPAGSSGARIPAWLYVAKGSRGLKMLPVVEGR